MEPHNIEKMTAFSLLLIGLTLLFLALSLSGLFQLPMYGMLVLAAGAFAIITALVLLKDSRRQM